MLFWLLVSFAVPGVAHIRFNINSRGAAFLIPWIVLRYLSGAVWDMWFCGMIALGVIAAVDLYRVRFAK